MNEQKKRFLYHESSHAVISFASGSPFSFVMQVSDSCGVCQVDWTKAERRKFGEQLLLTTVAGEAGERVAGFETNSMQVAFGLAPKKVAVKDLAFDDFSKLANLNADLSVVMLASLRSESYLRAHWNAVKGVADALEDKSFLSQSDVEKIVGKLPSIFEHTISLSKQKNTKPKPRKVKKWATKKEIAEHLKRAYRGTFGHEFVSYGIHMDSSSTMRFG